MAQLIKLQDYVSRYEWNIYRYPTRYIRLKRENWNKLYKQWMQPVEEIEPDFVEEKEELPVMTRLKNRFLKKQVHSETIVEEVEEETRELATTEEELKQQFLDNLLNFQMKWASSTVTKKSTVEKKYYKDPNLKYLLQRFPDTFLVMYYPVFSIKQAPIEAEIIVISPIDIEIIHFIDLESSAVIMAGEERTWHVESPKGSRRILNPVISLKRTEALLRSILSTKDIDFPINKTVLARQNQMIFAHAPYQTRMIDQHHYEEWFNERRRLVSPLKKTQIKAAETLLEYCRSTSFRRPEWEKGSVQQEVEEN